MNSLYFYCDTCKEYINAGYRWAYWTLEKPGIVTRGQPINTESVLAAQEYWTVDFEGESEWLGEVLPQANDFINIHKSHKLHFGEDENFLSYDETDFVWLDQSQYCSDESPRYFVERLGYTKWSDVEKYVKDNTNPWWWYYRELLSKAKELFDRITIGQSHPTDG